MPRLLAMLSVVAVFVPSFFMTGVSRSLFVPLSLAVGFSMIASFFLSSSLVPVLSVWLLGEASPRATADRTPSDWVDRLRNRLGAVAAAAGAGARAARRGLRRRDHRDRGRRRPDARPRDLPAGGVEPVPAAVPRAGRHEVRVDRAAGRRRARRDQAGGRPGQRRHHARLRRRAALVVSDQHDLPVDRRLARRRAAGGAQAGRAAFGSTRLRGRRCAGASQSGFPTRSSRSSRATSSAGS